MHPTPHWPLTSRHTVEFLKSHWRLWLLPTIVTTIVVCIYAVTYQHTWEASQALIVRNEASNAEKNPGKFSQPDEMKTVQETILELLKSRSVLEAALREVGPPADDAHPEAWPTKRDIAALRKGVKFTPPKGAEFGKTEVFYLNVKAADHDRSIALSDAIFRGLQIESQRLRDLKAQSMIEELIKSVQVAKSDLDAATTTLATTEKQLGSDLPELRAMQDATSGDSALRRSVEEIRGQLRENTSAERANEELLTVLQTAQEEPRGLATISNRLLESQPSLRRLKEGLVDAQIRTAALMGTMSAEHPRVQAALETQDKISQHLHNELAMAIRGLRTELRLNTERRALLNDQLAQAVRRLDGLAAVRATYANEVAEVKNRATLLERAEHNLAEARSSQASANAGSLISRIGSPDAGLYPIGPSRATIALLGVLGGLLIGFGLLFLSVPSAAGVTLPTAVADGRPVLVVDDEYEPTASPICRDRREVRPSHQPSNGRSQNGRLTLKQALQRLAGSHTNGRGV